MKQCSTTSLKNLAPKEQGAVPEYRIARDVREALSRESPLHGFVIDQLIASGKWQEIDL